MVGRRHRQVSAVLHPVSLHLPRAVVVVLPGGVVRVVRLDGLRAARVAVVSRVLLVELVGALHRLRVLAPPPVGKSHKRANRFDLLQFSECKRRKKETCVKFRACMLERHAPPEADEASDEDDHSDEHGDSDDDGSRHAAHRPPERTTALSTHNCAPYRTQR